MASGSGRSIGGSGTCLVGEGIVQQERHVALVLASLQQLGEAGGTARPVDSAAMDDGVSG